MKSTTSCRIAACYPGRNTSIYFESQYELDCVQVFWARNDVIDVEVQYDPIPFIDETGKHVHYFDLRVTYHNGEVVLYACRPKDLDKSGKLAKALENIRNQNLHFHADRCELLTEDDVTEALVYRSRDILRARTLRNSSNCDRMLELLQSIGRPIQVFKLQQMFGQEGAAWNAMWNLIGDGLVEHRAPDGNSILTHLSWVALVE